MLGVSAGFFFLIMWLLCRISGVKLLVNVDGIEWRRTKFSKPVRLLLKLFDALAQFAADQIIYDSPDLIPYIYTPFRKKACHIAYPGDHAIRLPDVKKEPTALTICRIEPENNIELLLEGVLRSQLSSYTIIGNWQHSEYARGLREKYRNHDKLKLLDPVYDPLVVARYRESCTYYLHGHSVGGTNPSLVEMLFYDCFILCFDCNFNRSTAGADADYFRDADHLAAKIDRLMGSGQPPPRSMPLVKYTAVSIAAQYVQAATGYVAAEVTGFSPKPCDHQLSRQTRSS